MVSRSRQIVISIFLFSMISCASVSSHYRLSEEKNWGGGIGLHCYIFEGSAAWMPSFSWKYKVNNQHELYCDFVPSFLLDRDDDFRFMIDTGWIMYPNNNYQSGSRFAVSIQTIYEATSEFMFSPAVYAGGYYHKDLFLLSGGAYVSLITLATFFAHESKPLLPCIIDVNIGAQTEEGGVLLSGKAGTLMGIGIETFYSP